MALLVRAKAIVTCETDAPQNGITFQALGLIENGSLLIEEGRIAAIESEHSTGHREERTTASEARGPEQQRGVTETLDFPDCIIVPGFIDAHTHPLFAGRREPGQDMLHTVRETRKALEDPSNFWKLIEGRLKLMLAHGTTTAEVKTGYVLTASGELQLLDLIDTHKEEYGLPQLIATFLGPHALPPEFSTADPFLDYLIEECLPHARGHGAVYADAFCEPGAFTPSQCRRYLEAARWNGLRLRVHCNEMTHSGAAVMASELKVDAIDHCNVVESAEIKDIAGSGAVIVACPATIEYLGLEERAPIRELLEAGATVALASDFNPGTSPCFNVQTVAHYGRKLFGLTAAEALYGVTVAAAKSLRLDAGRLRPGARADFVALQIDSPAEFGFQFGGNLAHAVFRSGERIA